MIALLGSLFSQAWGYVAMGAAAIGIGLWFRQSGANSQKVSDLAKIQKDQNIAHQNAAAVDSMSAEQLDSIVRKPDASG